MSEWNLLIDKTEKCKQPEKVLRESEENLRTTLNSIGDEVIAVDTEGCLTHMNSIGKKIDISLNKQPNQVKLWCLQFRKPHFMIL